jgi:glycosyltransferase involved in cell wall biosynthesis
MSAHDGRVTPEPREAPGVRSLATAFSVSERASAPLINITIPGYNEEHTLTPSIQKISAFLKSNCAHPYEIVIAENGSSDNTFQIAKQLEQDLPNIRALHVNEKGRGRAIKTAWQESRADILSYMDVDLSTDLVAFPPLIDALANKGFDIAIGSRLLDPALTKRGLKRETISRGYNLLVRAVFRTRFSDAQCGFKAITRRAATELLPLIEDGAWFMDTELLVLAEKLGYRILDLPVRWTDDPDSRVKLWSTALADIKGLMRLRRNLASGRYSSRHQTTPNRPSNITPPFIGVTRPAEGPPQSFQIREGIWKED